MKRSIGILTFALLLVILLAACGGGGDDGDAIREDYVYLAEFLSMPDVTERIHGSITHEGRIYFTYVETEAPDGYAEEETLTPPVSTIIITGMLPDGSHVSRTEIPRAGTMVDVAGFRLTEDGNFALIFTDTQWTEDGSDTLVLYAEYSPQGAELYRREIAGLVPDNASWLSVRQALFLDEGGVALAIETGGGGVRFNAVYLLDEQFSPRGRLELHDFSMATAPLAQTRDGRLFMLDAQDCPEMFIREVLREIDLDANAWGKTFPLDTLEIIYSLHPAREDSPFDLYVVSERYLFAYCLEAGSETTILNWGGSRVFPVWDASHLNFLDDGRLSVLIGRLQDPEAGERHTEHIVLTRTARADLGDREVITVAGFFGVCNLVQEMAAEFNRWSHTHEVQIRSLQTGGTWAGWLAVKTQLILDIMAGEGPDIIFNALEESVSFINAGLFLDLYPFIDADPELNRSDFLPNILVLLETGDGRLPMIAHTFFITSLLGMTDTVGDIDSWTFSRMSDLIEQALDANMRHILRYSNGSVDTRLFFEISTHWYADLGFIDLEENRANFDNAEFIALLELLARFSRQTANIGISFGPGGDYIRANARQMLDGEQLFMWAWLRSLDLYRSYRLAFGDDVIFVGWPTSEGGRHEARFGNGLAINANSAHPEAAWEFIRIFLMPGIQRDWDFSLRIDDLDDMLASAKIPRLELDANGKKVEVSRRCPYYHVDLYALTEAEAQAFRSIVEGVGIRGYFIHGMWPILEEELLPFLAGDRSAAETARIMQNRVQTFLAEQG